MDRAEADKILSQKTNDELLAHLQRPGEWQPVMIEAARAQLLGRGVRMASEGATPDSIGVSAARKPTGRSSTFTITLSTNDGPRQYSRQVDDYLQPEAVDVVMEQAASELRGDILQLKIPSETEVAFETTREKKKPQIHKGTLIQCAPRYARLQDIYRPVRRHARSGMFYGILAGAALNIFLLGLLVYQSDQTLGEIFFALPLAYLVILLKFNLKVRVPQFFVTVSLLAAVGVPGYLAAQGSPGAMLLGAIVGGALLFCMPGRSVGAIVGTMRRSRIPHAFDAPEEKPPHSIGVPLLIGAVIWAGYIYAVRAYLPSLLSGSSLTDSSGFVSDFFGAVQFGDENKVSKLLRMFPGLVSVREESGETPLHFAAGGDKVEIVKMLLDHGADGNAKTNGGGTPLCRTTPKANLEIARLLMDHGADVNAPCEASETVLNTMIDLGNNEFVELLLQHGADVNEKGMNGMTALHSAATSGNVAISNMLLDHGADVNAKAADGNTPLHFAEFQWTVAQQQELIRKPGEGEYKDEIELLRKHGGHD